MFLHQLLDLPKLEYNKGFRLLPKGKVIWTDVHVDGDRRRIRVSRTVIKPTYDQNWGAGEVLQTVRQYVKPMTEVEIQK